MSVEHVDELFGDREEADDIELAYRLSFRNCQDSCHRSEIFACGVLFHFCGSSLMNQSSNR